MTTPLIHFSDNDSEPAQGDSATAAGLAEGDRHLAARIGRLVGEDDPLALLTLRLAIAAARAGSTCLDLDLAHAALVESIPDLPTAADWSAAVAGSKLALAGVLELDQRVGPHLIYLQRYRAMEVEVAEDLIRRAEAAPVVDTPALDAALDRLFPNATDDPARAAARDAATRHTTIVTGGPGSGKTWLVARILAVLAGQSTAAGHPLRVALAAPTGRAADRLSAAIGAASAELTPADSTALQSPTAVTVHRLLGSSGTSGLRPRYDRSRPLPHDVVVLDEASMVSLSQLAALLAALRPLARLILVGDPDQLGSVDAGTALADLVSAGRDGETGHPFLGVHRLTGSHRFDTTIGQLADAVRTGDADAAIEMLATSGETLELLPHRADPNLRRRLLDWATTMSIAARSGDDDAALAALADHRLLCGPRSGPDGVAAWNTRVETWLAEATSPWWADHYPGRPILVTRTDYAQGLHNGDAGVIVTGPGGLVAAIETGAGPRRLAVSRLGEIETMFASTVHKSQGGQADEVTIVLPRHGSRLLTRQWLYTAITRAKRTVTIVGVPDTVRATIANEAARASGLADRLRALDDGRAPLSKDGV